MLRSLAGDVPVSPVVKADAYGHGAVPVAQALAAAGADGLCVATFDEAVVLREAGIDRPIVVLYPIPPELAREAADERIAVTAGDETLLDRLLAQPGLDQIAAPLAVHLEVETGLGRGGFEPEALTPAADRLRAAPGVRLASVWTHMQASDDEAITARQLRRFEEAVSRLREAGHDLPRHAAASGGILEGGVASLDGVRPGLAIYGLVPDELLGGGRQADARARELRPVMSLRAQPVRVANLPAGSGISYGPTFTTSRPSRIATLPLGYGDGWSRALSNRAEALVRGVRVPIVGNVAMDAIMADVTDVPGLPVGVEDEFVLIGRQGDLEITALDLARARATNQWEVVTNMAARLPRVYHAASGPQGLRTLVSGTGPRPRRTLA